MGKKKCFVPSCQNTSENAPKKLFLLLPLDQDRRNKWYEAVNERFVPKGSRVYCCEDHFDLNKDVDNWMEFKTIGTRIRINSAAVPHKYIHSPKPTELLQESQLSLSSRKRQSTALQPLGEIVKKKFLIDPIYEPGPSTPALPSTTTDEIVDSPSGPFTIHTEQLYFNIEPKAPKMVSKYVQTRRMIKVRSVSTNTQGVAMQSRATCTENKMWQATISNPLKTSLVRPAISESSNGSFSSASSLFSTDSSMSSSSTWKTNHIDNQMYYKKHQEIIETKSRFYLGLPKDTYFIVHICTRVGRIQYTNVLITLKKIRLDDKNTRLADDFGLSDSYIGKIFNKTVPLLANLFKQLLFWQDADYIKAMLPIPFRYRHKKLQSILDCLEMEIEIPTDPVNQALTWSNYKKCNTIKYLISATPHGFINFVSQGYGGRASDNIIITTSGYFEALPNSCEIMVDRGFKNIGHLLASKNCLIVRPPSVKESVKPSKDEVKETRRIAALRIHIERVIRRLREFYMLRRHVCVNNNYLYLYDYIVIIACGIVNVQGLLIQ